MQNCFTKIKSLQDRLVFNSCPSNGCFQFQHRPKKSYQEIYLHLSETVQLHAVLFYSLTETELWPKDRRNLIFYFHGNANHIQEWSASVLPLNKRGYDVLLMDYRTFGKSRGDLSESALRQDCLVWYHQMVNIEKYNPSLITLHGVSIGTYFALALATDLYHLRSKGALNHAEHGSSNAAVSQQPNTPLYHQLSLVMPFDEIFTLAKKYVGLTTSYLAWPFFKYEMNNLKHVPYLEGKVSVIHSRNDPVIPFASFEKLSNELETYSRKGHFHMSKFVAENAGHQVYFDALWKTYEEEVFPEVVTELCPEVIPKVSAAISSNSVENKVKK